MMLRAFAVLAAVCAAAEAAPDPVMTDTFAVAPGAGNTLWTLTVSGHIEHLDETGKRIEDLGIAKPWADRLWDGLRRIEPVPGGVLVLSHEGLVKVTPAGSQVVADDLLTRGALDFAASADGKVIVIVTSDPAPQGYDVVSVLEGEKLRRIGAIRSAGHGRAAIDPAGKWLALQHQTSIYDEEPGALAVFSLADGKQLFAQKRCNGGFVRAISSTQLAACLPLTGVTDKRFGIAVYAVPSGKVARSWSKLEGAIAVSRDNRTVLVSGMLDLGYGLSVLDLTTGKHTELPVEWKGYAYGEFNDGAGVWLGANRVAMPGLRLSPRPPVVYDVAKAPWADR